MKLSDALERLHKEEKAYFAMPGHKRKLNKDDITEIEGFDNLSDPDGILLELISKISDLYHSKQTWLSVQGSTLGNLVAIHSSAKRGDKIIIPRNSHRSIYAAVELRGLNPIYVYPNFSENGYQMPYQENVYLDVIEANKDAAAVVIICPTYEGAVLDISKIAHKAHEYDMAVIVDAAHGAHLDFYPDVIEGYNTHQGNGNIIDASFYEGADIVNMSTHKMLPAMTQTGLIHLMRDDIIDSKKLGHYFNIFSTSSPSYVLMNSIEKSFEMAKDIKIFREHIKCLESFYDKCSSFSYLKVEPHDGYDRAKIIIELDTTNLNGPDLLKALDDKGIILEMASYKYVLGISTIVDNDDELSILYDELKRIDNQLSQENNITQNYLQQNDNSADILLNVGNILPVRELDIWQAVEMPQKTINIDNAENEISADYISIYPPASPIVVPGEVISKEVIKAIKNAKRIGLSVTGLEILDEEVSVKVVEK